MVNARRTEEVCIDVSAGGLRADWEILVLDYGVGFSAHLCPCAQVFFRVKKLVHWDIGVCAFPLFFLFEKKRGNLCTLA